MKDALARVIATIDAAFSARFACEADERDPESRAMLASAVLHSLAIRARAGQGREELARLAHAGAIALAPPTEAARKANEKETPTWRA